MSDLATQFDLGYAARQVALLAALGLAPAFVWSASRPRRWLVGGVLLVFCVTVIWLLGLTVARSTHLWSHDGLPYEPFRVGPSSFTLMESVPGFAAILWTPACGAWLYLRGWRRRAGDGPGSFDRIVPGLVIAYMVAACLALTVVTVATEIGHEDTVVADGFSQRGWRNVENGITRNEVYDLLGHSLPGPCHFGPTAECWVSNYSAGHFAVIWFAGDRVVEARWWYSD